MQALVLHTHRFSALFAGLLLLQVAFWWHTHLIRPETDVVPAPPGKAALQALAFGDNEFYFRAQALQLQNFGDDYGRTVSLRYYNYTNLYQWLMLLDTLDARSDMLPSMAAYYFSQTQNINDVRYLANYLYAHATQDGQHKWWWLLQGIYLAMHKIHDMDLALKLAKPMMAPGVPVWAQEMTAVVYEKRGEMDDALRIIDTIQKNADYISDRDLRFMKYFVDERIKHLDNKPFIP